MDEKEIRRKKQAAAAREQRRKRRKRAVMIERTAIALLIVVFLVGGTVLIWNLMPGIKVAKRLEAADAFVETSNYEEAIASCEEALQIDSKSVEAYRAMAGVYLTSKDREAAEQTLYRGWECTLDEGLLQEYCVHLLNDAVEEINGQNCTFATLDKCVTVLENDQDSADVYQLLDACYEHLFVDDTTIFCDVNENGMSGFNDYLSLMNRMMDVCSQNSKEELKQEILKFAAPSGKLTWINVGSLQEYLELIGRVSALGDAGNLEMFKLCLEKAVWAQNLFGTAFTIFESGEFEPIKEFMQSADYIAVRDQFISGTMEYWSGKTYIPVSRERMKLLNQDGQWSFAFAAFDEYPQTSGVINIWGAKQEDAGVQRLCISYEPASQSGEYYPHTTYEFVYLYSNVKIAGEYVPQMNYRFETRTAAPEGTTSQLIGDWGGEYEWTMDY